MMKNIIIKDTPELQTIAMQFNRTPEEISDLILQKMAQVTMISDSCEFAGERVIELFSWDDYTPASATLYVFGTHYSDLEKLFSTLIVFGKPSWGKSRFCPICGCELERGDENDPDVCTHCDYYYSER